MSGWERLWLFNIRELAEHRVRTVLSVAVVAVAASLLVAVFGISGSITGSVQRFAADVGGNADLEVSGVTDSGFPATLQPEVAKVGGVAAAVPMLRTGLGAPNDPDRMLLIGLDQGANALRSSAIGDSMQAHIGALVRTPNGVLVGAATGYTTGQQIRIGKGSATVAAVVAETRLNGGHFAAAPLPLAQQLAGRPGQLDSILVVAEPGADLDTVRTAIAAAVGGRAVVAAPDLRAAQASTAIQIITVGTLMTASVSLVVAAFLIYTATGMAITQRRPRIAMLRALGGNGRTIVRDLVAEAALLGALGAAVGSVLGIFMGRSALRELPAAVLASVEVRTEYHLPGYAIPVAIALGIGACVAATALAARQVYKVEPVEALVPMEVAGTEVAGGRLRAAGAVLGVALIATAVLTMRLDLGRGALFGLAFSFVGVMLIGFALTTQLVAAAAAIARLFGAPGALAAATVERAPRRVWATLMTVIAAVSLTVVTTASNQNLVDSATTSFDFFADTDLYVSGTGPGVFPTAPLLPENLEAQLAAVPGVERVGPAQMAFATVGTTKVMLQGFGAEALAESGRELTPAQLRGFADGTGVLISRDAARTLGTDVGEHIELPTPAGVQRMEVLGVLPYFSGFTGVVMMRLDTLRTWYGRPGSTILEIDFAPGANPTDAVRALAAPDELHVYTGAQALDAVSASVRQGTGLINAISWIVVAVAGVALLNTLMLSVFERRRELGVLRAAGSSRRFTVTMILAEAAGIGLLGGAVGLAVGAATQWLAASALTRMVGVDVVYEPTLSMFVIACGATLLSLFGALPPAQRAARLNIVEAVSVD